MGTTEPEMSEYIKVWLRVLWGVLLVCWLLMGIRTKKPSVQEGFHHRFLFYWLPLMVAAYLLGPGEWFGHSLIRENFVPHTDRVGIIGLILSTVGVCIACWSRYLLGGNWSLSVQKKEAHALITSGPYKWVRHPIYSGLLLLFLGNAVIVGDYRGLLAVAIVLLSFWYKLRKEERLLVEVFGAEYIAYTRRTKALVPWVC